MDGKLEVSHEKRWKVSRRKREATGNSAELPTGVLLKLKQRHQRGCLQAFALVQHQVMVMDGKRRK